MTELIDAGLTGTALTLLTFAGVITHHQLERCRYRGRHRTPETTDDQPTQLLPRLPG